MITEQHAEERVRRWLQARAPGRLPDRVLADTFDRTRPMAQVAGGRPRRFFTERARPILFATGAVAVALIGVAVGLGTTQPAQVAAPLTSNVSQAWITTSDVAVTIQRDPTDDRAYYWRAVAYDHIDLRGLASSDLSATERAPGARVFEGMADDVEATGLHGVTFTVWPATFADPTVLSPATPIQVDRPVRLATVGPDGYFASLTRDGGDSYTVTALVADWGDAVGMLNTAALRAAGTDYPSEVVALYTTEVPGMFGPNLRSLRDEVVTTANSTAPIDVAERLVQVLRAESFTYDVDVRDIDCGAMSTAECFATFRRGYCEHYAMTMAVILRNLGIPARIVEGFLPGERSQGSATEVIRNSDAHAWVEVYFPGYGWVAFDPSARGLPQQLPASLPSGPPTAGAPRP
jgi:transglutaminase-like putative cysteine protease